MSLSRRADRGRPTRFRGSGRATLGLALSLALAGCADPEPEPERAPEPAVAAPGTGAGEGELAPDAGAPAGAAAVVDAGTTAASLPRPAGGFHLDSDAIEYRPRPVRPPKREPRPIELLLRSSPSGATAAIDGTMVGTTPTYWAGRADGKAHEFTFVKPGYAMARYRFVPTQGGIVHGTLEPLTRPDKDAGIQIEAPPSH